MLFTWDTTNLCVIFRWWHIRSTPGLLFSLLAIIALAAGYECLRSFSRRFERWAASSQSDIPDGSTCQKAKDAAPVLTPIPMVCSLVWSIVYQGKGRSACNGRHSRSP